MLSLLTSIPACRGCAVHECVIMTAVLGGGVVR